MTDFNATAELVRRSGEKVRDFLALGDELKAIGSIDLARAETQAAFENVTAELEAAKAELEAVEKEHATFLMNRTKALATHKAALEEVTDAANKAAAETISQANKAASNLLDAANAEVARVQGAHAEAMKTAVAELQAARAELDAVLQQTEAAHVDRETLTKSIRDMRNLARTALEGATTVS